jgi:predicted alpha/beta superfamily hydrolase
MSKIEIFNLFSKELNKDETVRVYLPEGYDRNNNFYPVLYMHDGQNIFNGDTDSFGMGWEINKILDNKYKEKDFKGFIVVGVDCPKLSEDRLNEYSPFRYSFDKLPVHLEMAIPISELGGKGVDYSKFIVNTLLPYIEGKYRVSKKIEDTFIAGSSMGALISLYIGLENPNTFSKIGCFSPAFWFCEKDLLNFVASKTLRLETKVYFDIGTKESSNDEHKEEFAKVYINSTKNVIKEVEKQIPPSNIKFIIEEGAVHNEVAWNRRFPEFLDFII